ncbi:ABC transporter [Microbacterium sp. NPDC090225]|uniref:ABC transporter n=1 Tax=Microbacterium sp. NPDC090225 TaxID=3364207 RepID=UPI003826A835
MSDPEVPQPERPKDVNDVLDSANEGLDAAAAAGADVPAGDNAAIHDAATRDNASSAAVPDAATTDAATAAPATERSAAPVVDPDLAAFEAAERDHPGTFSAPVERRDPAYGAEAAEATEVIAAPAAYVDETPTVADTAYSSRADAETTIVPSEPAFAAAASSHPQPIFVQAPEPPRDRGNRGTAGAIGLLATLAFAVLYLGATLGLGALAGDVDGNNIGQAALAPLQTAGYWVPVAVFFLGFWLLGAIINRGRWGLWVVFGIIVGAIAYGGHLLGQLFQAQFWTLTASEGADLIGGQLLAPLAIVAFVFARELTIWFGAWVARSGARKTELNLEAQREYERTLEAGPTLSR